MENAGSKGGIMRKFILSIIAPFTLLAQGGVQVVPNNMGASYPIINQNFTWLNANKASVSQLPTNASQLTYTAPGAGAVTLQTRLQDLGFSPSLFKLPTDPDDTASVQACVNTLWCTLPAGKFYLSDTITLPPSAHLNGAWMYAGTGITHFISTAANPFATGGTGGLMHLSNFWVEGSGSSGTCIDIKNSNPAQQTDQSIIENIGVSGCVAALMVLHDPTITVVRDISLVGPSAYGLKVIGTPATGTGLNKFSHLLAFGSVENLHFEGGYGNTIEQSYSYNMPGDNAKCTVCLVNEDYDTFADNAWEGLDPNEDADFVIENTGALATKSTANKIVRNHFIGFFSANRPHLQIGTSGGGEVTLTRVESTDFIDATLPGVVTIPDVVFENSFGASLVDSVHKAGYQDTNGSAVITSGTDDGLYVHAFRGVQNRLCVNCSPAEGPAPGAAPVHEIGGPADANGISWLLSGWEGSGLYNGAAMVGIKAGARGSGTAIFASRNGAGNPGPGIAVDPLGHVVTPNSFSFGAYSPATGGVQAVGTEVQAVLGDQSDYAPFRASNFAATSGGLGDGLVCYMSDAKQMGHCTTNPSGTPPTCTCSQ